MAEVVSLHCGSMATNEPCADVIDLLEQYLAEARRGEIIGIALAVVDGNNSLATQWCSGRADRHFVLAATVLLQDMVCRSITDAEE